MRRTPADAMGSRRRSLSASRTLDQTVNLVGRIGASLRISARRKPKKKEPDSDQNSIYSQGLISLPPRYASPSLSHRSLLGWSNPHSAVNSPQLGRLRALEGTASCPATPEVRRRRFVKDGATQLTSLSTLLTHHRHFFLFDDVLLVSKHKQVASWPLMSARFQRLQQLQVQGEDPDSTFVDLFEQLHPLFSYRMAWFQLCCAFQVGETSLMQLYFSAEAEKDDWFSCLSASISHKLLRTFTTISVAVKVDGRHQVSFGGVFKYPFQIIRHEIHNGVTSSEILSQLVKRLHLGIDLNAFELLLESQLIGCQLLHGIENVYALLMHQVQRLGLNLSESQLQHLDTCPLVNCRLVLQTSLSPVPAHNIVNNVKRAIMSRIESKKLFGRKLEGSMPPQPVLTMIDYLSLKGVDVEGIFRKSPKQSTVRNLRSLLDHGHVPDFSEYSPHVTASLLKVSFVVCCANCNLKDYLRSIPGQLLLSGNYHLWMEVCDQDALAVRLEKCRNLLQLLPPSHMVLLRSILKLLRRVSRHPQSKMNPKSLAVCIAPSLLENPVRSMDASIKKVPDLAEFLMENAPALFDMFEEEGPLLPQNQLSQSTDSGLSCEPINLDRTNFTASPDSALFDSPGSDGSSTGVDEKRVVPTSCTPKLRDTSQTSDYYSPFKPRLVRLSDSGTSTSSWQETQRIGERRWTPQALPALPPCSPPTHRPPSPRVFHRKDESSDSTATLVAAEANEVQPCLRGSRLNSISSLHSNTTTVTTATNSPRTVKRPLLSKQLAMGLSDEVPRRETAPPPPAASNEFTRTAALSTNNRPTWRPPRRTAEEIVLGNLEVNWSVPSIRSVFQQQKDQKPAHIDTVYATFQRKASK